MRREDQRYTSGPPNGRDRRRRPAAAVVILLLMGLAGRAGAAGPPQAVVIEHTPVSSFVPGSPLTIQAAVKGEPAWVTFYFRTPGAAQFQARPMVLDKEAAYTFVFDTSVLAADKFEYYLEAEKDGKKTSAPMNAPAGVLAVAAAAGGGEAPSLPQSLPAPEAEEARLKIPVHASGSLQGTILEEASGEPAPGLGGNGNVQFGFEALPAAAVGMRLDSNVALMSAPPEGANSADLASLMLAVTSGSHAFRTGDLNINETELTAYGLGRRGIEYAFDNQKIYLHAFTANTQQLQGFKGFGVPKSQTGMLGGAVGFKTSNELLSLRAIFLTGKDDPSQGVNAGAAPQYTAREGLTLAVVEETKLFNGAFAFRGEFAHSSYDGDLTDGASAVGDNAWNAGANVVVGGFQLSAIYRHLGRNFNSVGLSALANDRQGLESNLTFTLGIVSLQGQYIAQEDNVEGDLSRPTTSMDSGLAGLNLAISPEVALALALKFTGQDTVSAATPAENQDTRTSEQSATLSWSSSTSSSFNLGLTNSRLTSRANPTSDASGLTLSFGGSFRVGEIMLLAPTVGLTHSKTLATGETNTTLNLYLMTEIYFVPEVLSFLFTGSFNRMEQAAISVSDAVDIVGGINFYLGKLIRVNSFLLTLRASHRSSSAGETRTRDTRILAQTDIAF